MLSSLFVFLYNVYFKIFVIKIYTEKLQINITKKINQYNWKKSLPILFYEVNIVL